MLFNNGMFMKVDRTRCLNFLHNGVSCTHCVTNCPNNALEMKQRGISLIEDQCFGCGVCLTDCPTQVFTANQWDESSVVTEVRKQGYEATQFFCDDHDHPYLSKAEKQKGAIKIPTCLSSLSKVAWYEIGLYTRVELRLDKCEDCPMNECLYRLQRKVNTAIEWLEASGHVPEFTLIKSVDKVEMNRKLKAVSSGMKTTSRRDLFLNLFNQGKEVVEKARDTNRSKNIRLEISLLPTWRKRLEKTFTRNFQEGGTPAYWPSIQKKDSCANCGICTSNCPTKALQVNIIEKKAIHTFNSGQCIDCRLCMLFCPTESIIRDRKPNEAPFETEVLLEVAIVACKHCGELASDNEKNTCYWCENKASDDEMITDFWKYV